MLELILTRPDERRQLIQAAQGLQFLVLDELHTYRGRQGADVALLVRRVRDACDAPDLQCVGTSATMATEGDAERPAPGGRRGRDRPVRRRRSRPDHVIGETLRRATTDPAADRRRARCAGAIGDPAPPAELRGASPPTRWPPGSRRPSASSPDRRPASPRRRRRPPTLPEAARAARRADRRRRRRSARRRSSDALQAGSRISNPATGRPLFAFRLHQFLSKGDTVYVTLEPPSDPAHHRAATRSVVPGDRDGKVLLPLAFCRECGQEYLRGRPASDRDGAPVRRPAGTATPAAADAATGYLYVSRRPAVAATTWTPRSPSAAARLLARVPTAAGQRRRSRPTAASTCPSRCTVDADRPRDRPGDGGLRGRVRPDARSAFCLRCGVSYEQARGSDFAKLATLSAEGRSSAMSLITRQHRPRPARAADGDLDDRGPQAADVRRQPAGRLACRPGTSTTSSRSPSCAARCTGRWRRRPGRARPTRSSPSGSPRRSA